MLETIKEILKKCVYLEDADIDVNKPLADIGDWDSYSQIALFSEIESTLKIKLSFDEMMEMNTVGAIVTILTRKLEQA